MTTKHTPWFVIDHPNGWTIQDREHGGGSCIAQHYGDAKLGRKYADQIVRCVNSHDALVAALQKCSAAFASWQMGQIPGRPEDILALTSEVRAALTQAQP